MAQAIRARRIFYTYYFILFSFSNNMFDMILLLVDFVYSTSHKNGTTAFSSKFGTGKSETK